MVASPPTIPPTALAVSVQIAGAPLSDSHRLGPASASEMDLFLEYDRGTEPLERLAAKLAAYRELADATQIPTPVLFWLPPSGREAAVRHALAGEGRWGWVQFPVATASPTLGLGPAEAA